MKKWKISNKWNEMSFDRLYKMQMISKCRVLSRKNIVWTVQYMVEQILIHLHTNFSQFDGGSSGSMLCILFGINDVVELWHKTIRKQSFSFALCFLWSENSSKKITQIRAKRHKYFFIWSFVDCCMSVCQHVYSFLSFFINK